MRYPEVSAAEYDAAMDTGPDPMDFLCECGAEPTGGTVSRPLYADCTCDEEPQLALVTLPVLRPAA